MLEELGLSYHTIFLAFDKGEHKAPAYTQHNPNGRTPTLIDHANGDFTIWESGAIILYLADKYDPERRLSVESERERYAMIQWLFFQASGQGYVAPLLNWFHVSVLIYHGSPYFGQAGHFQRLHPEKIPSAIERYLKEILRVFGVLDSVLAKQEWLVGDKCTIADLAFIPWNNGVIVRQSLKDMPGVDVPAQFPAFWA